MQDGKNWAKTCLSSLGKFDKTGTSLVCKGPTGDGEHSADQEKHKSWLQLI